MGTYFEHMFAWVVFGMKGGGMHVVSASFIECVCRLATRVVFGRVPPVVVDLKDGLTCGHRRIVLASKHRIPVDRELWLCGVYPSRVAVVCLVYVLGGHMSIVSVLSLVVTSIFSDGKISRPHLALFAFRCA